jgi:nitrogen regulatory protein PII
MDIPPEPNFSWPVFSNSNRSLQVRHKSNKRAASSNAMTIALPTGKWSIYGDKEEGELNIISVDTDGKWTGTAFGDNAHGSFDATSGKIRFSRTWRKAVNASHLYTGNLSTIKPEHYLLGGSYSQTEDKEKYSEQFGWYAIKPPLISNLSEQRIEPANMKKIEIILPHGMLPDVHSVLKDLNVGGMSHYEIEGSGRVKEDPVVAATHPRQTPPEYIGRTKVEVVIKNEQAEDLISKLREKLRGVQGGKIFVEDVRDAIDIPTNKRGEGAI